MNFDLQVDRVINVTINGREYPVSVTGTGFPVVVIGTGTLVQRTLSKNFKSQFTVYSTDLYWDERYALPDDETLSIARFIDDINALVAELQLSEYVLCGHSAFGMFALEFAKKYPEHAAGIVMIGTPLNSNQEVAAQNNRIFQAEASEERKRIDAQRKASPLPEGLRDGQKIVEWCTWRHAAQHWHDPLTDSTPIWQGLVPSKNQVILFSEIFPTYDVCKNLDKVKDPVFLAAGLSDYDCCPAQAWATVQEKLPSLQIAVFEKSAHYPQCEEGALFDQRFLEWFTATAKTSASSR